MKKLLYIPLLIALLLTGCDKNSIKIPPADLFLLSGNTTSAGVRPGDTPDIFTEAYGDYSIQVAYNHAASNYITMSVRKIPFDEDISTLIASFFIDNEPVSESMICDTYDVAPQKIHELISSSAFLRNHDVVYRYLRFIWEDGVIANIISSEINYNETYEIPRLD